MKKQIFTLLFSLTLVLSTSAQIIITEIMYNNPGADDYEYIEIYNNGMSTVNMDGWTMGGVTHTFSGLTLNAGEFAILSADPSLFDPLFGVTSIMRDGGALSNGGETVSIFDATGALIDEVEYDDVAPWPTSPDDGGFSLVLCDFGSDNNDPANWSAASTPTGFELNGMPIFANPGAVSNCSTDPFVGFSGSSVIESENVGSVEVTIELTNGNSNATEVTVNVDMSSTADSGTDYNFTAPQTITFPADMSSASETISIDVIDDMDAESLETIVLTLSNATNGAVLLSDTYTISIADNDSTADSDLVISGVFDAQPAASGTKGFELKAINNIPDLSVYGVESANNGTGSGGAELDFPSMALNAGDCIYVVDDSTKFADFFGFDADFVNSAANINGNDAIVLYKNGQIVDLFGDPDVDGSDEPWEYLDGWAYRQNGTGPDGASFLLSNWFFSGVDALDGAATNDQAMPPFPVCAYDPSATPELVANDDNATTGQGVAVDIFVLNNDNLPNGFTSFDLLGTPLNGMAAYNMGNESVTYTPDDDFCGDSDSFRYIVCDANACDTATVNVFVNCPTTYPIYDIATVTTVDANGVPDSIDRTCQLQGIVYGVDLQGNDNIQFYFIDGTGGISLFSSNNFGYTVQEGDEVVVQGTISEFNCLTQITPDTLWMVSSGNSLVMPATVTELNESTEAELVTIGIISWLDPSQWNPTGSGFNMDVNDGVNNFVIRIDNDVELFNMPNFANDNPEVHATGLGGQFDNDGVCDGGYQLLPRYAADLVVFWSTHDPGLAEKIKFYPNPVNDLLRIDAEIDLDEIVISNLFGQEMLRSAENQIDVSGLPAGMYTITFLTEDTFWSTEFVKM